jgi:hypothetical protein
MVSSMRATHERSYPGAHQDTGGLDWQKWAWPKSWAETDVQRPDQPGPGCVTRHPAMLVRSSLSEGIAERPRPSCGAHNSKESLRVNGRRTYVVRFWSVFDSGTKRNSREDDTWRLHASSARHGGRSIPSRSKGGRRYRSARLRASAAIDVAPGKERRDSAIAGALTLSQRDSPWPPTPWFEAATAGSKNEVRRKKARSMAPSMGCTLASGRRRRDTRAALPG